MKEVVVALTPLFLVAGMPVNAHHHYQSRESCTAYRHHETYKPGYYDHNGTWIRGRVQRGSTSIPCSTDTASRPPTTHSQHHHPYQHQYEPPRPPQNTSQPILINNTTTPTTGCTNKVGRMVIGAAGGAVAGNYMWGGRKSKNSVRNIGLSALAGSLLGRISC